ncbi:MAG: LLM class F420-dependent oxidoreductase [Mycobacterium sp.]|nr:LLM class F420-dependent oxidoreductase [Mycobacterium sp.]
MKFAVFAPLAAGVTADPHWMTLLAQHLEACGFESIVVAEHTVMVARYASVYPYAESGRVDIAADCPVPDPLELLAFLGGRTERLGLATGVLVLPNHHPVTLAKRAATVDVLSGGRLRLCVGVGWLKEEVEACGAEFGSRGRRADEQLQVLRRLWQGGDDGVSHRGEFFAFDHAVCRPQPRADLPIHIGGHSRAAARRAGRYGDGFQPIGVGGARLAELIAIMRDEATAAERDSRTLEVSLGHQVAKIDAERAGRLAEIGADRVVLALPSEPAITDINEVRDMLSACAVRLGLAR